VSIRKGPSGCYYSTLLSVFEELEHAFGTAVAGPAPGYALVHQIHSRIVTGVGEAADADALVTSLPGQRVAVKTADCVPVLIYDPRQHAVAAVHSGWRGTVANIAGAAVEEMTKRFGSHAGDLRAAIGPAIGGCCYEVGPEVAREFKAIFPERADLDTRTHIDLTEAVRRELMAAGLGKDCIDTGAPCTCCTAELNSWRRTQATRERNYSAIGLRPPAPPAR